MSGDGRATPPGYRRSPYSGSRRKLVLAFDVGTTYSGISYSILDPGQVPSIKGVTQFPAQEATNGACKIPTIIYYDQQGKARAIGAEATQDGQFEIAQEENWTKAEWFKLHLRSKFGNSKNVVESIPSLPPGKTVVDVIADFLAYLLKCVATYIQNTDPNGKALWNAFLSATQYPNGASNDGIHFVLSHPNGWEGKEQTQMRDAAIRARLISDTPENHNRITFVTEGEASLHFAIQNGLLSQTSESDGIVVVDAGGGTIDVSTYKRKEVRGKKTFEEIAVPRCYFHGSVFVTVAAKNFVEKTLLDSPFLDDLEHIANCFDKTTKLRFRNDQDQQYIKFGGTRDNDAHVNIRFGQMKLAGTDVAIFFRASIDCVVQAVMEQKKNAPQTIRASTASLPHVILVGGFAASDWLFNKVKDTLTSRGMTVTRPENNAVKAVSDGAVSFYLDHYVRIRVAKVTYGTPSNAHFDETDPEHQRRIDDVFTTLSGGKAVRGAFNVILQKGTQVKEDQEFSQALVQTTPTAQLGKTIEASITAYRGMNLYPRWMNVDPHNYTQLFRLEADVSRIPFIPRFNPMGNVFYEVEFEVVMMFGLTELQVHLRWEENGITRRSPAKLIYD